ncbi:alpha/beta fold hydrolase [Candidatus Poribacteria bacterium]|nr:alpha/beta fold hydrolase [Candidatus Poribacteria bacterium]
MKTDYWRVYYHKEVAERSDRIREEHTIQSTGVDIHIDVYPHRKSDAPVVIFNHGAAGYCRLFVQLALSFNEHGYTVVLPDQRGQGLSGGRRGDYTVSECVRNIVDAAHWAKNRFHTPLFIAGGSVGGALTYYAATSGAPADAIACLNLFDFGNGTDGIRISRLACLARYSSIIKLLNTGMILLSPLAGMRVPFRWMGAFEKLMDERDSVFQGQWDADPVPPRLVSIRSLASNLTTAPRIVFENNRLPVLVINQSLDRMVDSDVTRRNYERLKGPKRYFEVSFGHWSSQPEFWETIVQVCDEWFRNCGH